MGTEQIVSQIAARQHGVISRVQALDAGLSRSTIGTRTLSGQWVRIDTAVYAVAAAPRTWRRQLWAAYLSRPEGLVRCRVSTVPFSARHRRHLARTHNEGASARCVKAEDAARGVEGR